MESNLFYFGIRACQIDCEKDIYIKLEINTNKFGQSMEIRVVISFKLG